MSQVNQTHASVMQTIRGLAKNRKVVLNVGSGRDRKHRLDPRFHDEAQWFELRLDMNAAAKPHILGDLTDLSMLPDGAVAAVHSAHNLEHLDAHQVVPALQGFFRVLAWGGEVVVHTPDMQTIAAFIAQGKLEESLYEAPGGAVTPLDVVYGARAAIARGDALMAHRTGFTHATLAAKLKEAGFTNILMVRDRFDLMAVARKLPPNHAQRKTTVELKVTERYNPREAVAVTVDNLVNLPHPGLMIRGKQPDELDIPPAPLT
ncbi:MAG: SAM-dependent methyltransferase [Alphaproteobacteria bacterium]|nr:SAM-dependent methyltransferase [Alphaproteobacteria bacterium]